MASRGLVPTKRPCGVAAYCVAAGVAYVKLCDNRMTLWRVCRRPCGYCHLSKLATASCRMWQLVASVLNVLAGSLGVTL